MRSAPDQPGDPAGEPAESGGADPGAKYVCGRCADGYDVRIDKPTVPQPQIIMVVEPAGRTLPVKC